MNSSRRFFTKTALSLTALLFIGGCGQEQTQTASENLLTQTQTSANLEIVEYENFKIEYDRENLIVKIILKSNENITIVSKRGQDDSGRILTTLEGETILVLAYGHNEYKSSSKMGFGKDKDGNSLISLLPSYY
ncbi:MAG: hypothetical protein LBF13_04420 [Campylobacteraceae bacterium]|jgi:uncharacterized Fe-S cluster-containing protein|nr:hypothetical protein [Campylobacteraceae bacterium]